MGVTLGYGAMQGQEMDLIIPMGLFHLSLFCGSVSRCYPYGRKESIHSGSEVNSIHFLMHTLPQGSSMRQQPWVQPRGSAPAPVLCNLWGGGLQKPTTVLEHQWGWAVPRWSDLRCLYLANLQFLLCQEHVLPAKALQSPVCCVVCRNQSTCSLQAVSSILETSLHEWFIYTSGNELDWHEKPQEKLHPRCFCYDLVVFSVNTWHL